MVRKKLGVLFYESHAMLMFLETFSFSIKKSSPNKSKWEKEDFQQTVVDGRQVCFDLY